MTGADSLTLTGTDGLSQTVQATGSLVVSPTINQTYTLTVSNAGGGTSATVTIGVMQPIAWQGDRVFAFGKLISEDRAQADGSVQTIYIQSDQVGSPDIVSDASGALVGRSKNLPFGERFSEAGFSATNHPFIRFAGHEGDANAWTYMQAREYLPAYGRFAEPDPAHDQGFENPQSWDLYAYVVNDPITGVDRTGRWTGKIHVQLTAILAYAAGFSRESAINIGLATGRPDEEHNALDAGVRSTIFGWARNPPDPNSAWAAYLDEAKYHFPSLGYLPTLEKMFKESGSIHDFGYLEHLKQDSVNPGHAKGVMHGFSMDHTDINQSEAMKTAENTFNDLLSAIFKANTVKRDAVAIDYKALMPELKAYMATGESGEGYEKAKNDLWAKVDSLRRAGKRDSDR